MNDTILKQLGILIKHTRMSKLLSQEELAWRCGITKNGLGKIELGKSNIRILTLLSIFHHLDLDLSQVQCIIAQSNYKPTNKNNY